MRQPSLEQSGKSLPEQGQLITLCASRRKRRIRPLLVCLGFRQVWRRKLWLFWRHLPCGVIFEVCHRGVAQPGRAPPSGGGCRRFESSRPDQLRKGPHCRAFCIRTWRSSSLFLWRIRGWHGAVSPHHTGTCTYAEVGDSNGVCGAALVWPAAPPPPSTTDRSTGAMRTLQPASATTGSGPPG